MAITWTQTVDNLFVTTWSYRVPKATEQAFTKTPLIFWLRERGRIQNVRGYTRIEIPLEYGTNETVRWLSKGASVPIQDNELLTMAYDEWKYVAVSIVRYREEDQKNRGRARILNLIETKLNAAERALWEEFERVMFADGSGSNEPNGLQNIVATDPTTGTLHGIDRSTYSWFRNQTKQASGAASVYLVSDMRNMMNTITKYSQAEMRDIVIVTDQTTFELYEDINFEMKQIVNQKLADAGFDTLQFKGRPIIWCPSCPSGYMYFLNTNYIKLVCDEDYWMVMTDWKEPPDQPFDRVAQILCACNLVTSRPVCLGVLYGISA